MSTSRSTSLPLEPSPSEQVVRRRKHLPDALDPGAHLLLGQCHDERFGAGPEIDMITR